MCSKNEGKGTGNVQGFVVTYRVISKGSLIDTLTILNGTKQKNFVQERRVGMRELMKKGEEGF
jgi:hypothetical protein